jgi:hypothetical protein
MTGTIIKMFFQGDFDAVVAFSDQGGKILIKPGDKCVGTSLRALKAAGWGLRLGTIKTATQFFE